MEEFLSVLQKYNVIILFFKSPFILERTQNRWGGAQKGDKIQPCRFSSPTSQKELSVTKTTQKRVLQFKKNKKQVGFDFQTL